MLARPGVPPDPDLLLAALAARSWEARGEELEVGAGRASGRSPRFRALAIRSRAAGDGHGSHHHRQATGRTAEAALVRVPAAALARTG